MKRLTREKLESMGFELLALDAYNQALLGESPESEQLIVGVKVYLDSAVAFYTNSGVFLVMLQETLRRARGRAEPDFSDPEPIDGGRWVRFGECEFEARWIWAKTENYVETTVKL